VEGLECEGDEGLRSGEEEKEHLEGTTMAEDSVPLVEESTDSD
jgi:hypothetical protein